MKTENNPELQFEIKITGSGTRQSLANALKEYIELLESPVMNDQDFEDGEFEGPYLFMETAPYEPEEDDSDPGIAGRIENIVNQYYNSGDQD